MTSLSTLTERASAVKRRLYGEPARVIPIRPVEPFRWAPPACAKVYVPEPRPITLTPTMKAILSRLIYTPIPVPGDALVFGMDDPTARVHLSEFRKRLVGSAVEIIAIRGRGYWIPDQCRATAKSILEATP
jgi:hypothetical protein